MKSKEIKEKFINFFKKRNHKVFPSSSLVPDDPTLLLTGAGMVPFKPIFQGKVKVDFKRAASCQKCVRTTDIEQVGLTARHLTFFEMLGNFSFGDYYKEEAVLWAWEFLVGELRFDEKNLWITVFKDDDEAASIWEKEVGVARERIVAMGEEDNFWSAGLVGPCGPCTELVYDLGKDKGCGRRTCGIHCDCDRFLEVWNLVFMQYERDEKGKLEPLMKKGVDTGLGLERAALVLQGVSNNFETDLIFPILKKAAELAKVGYSKNKKSDISLKILADHARAITFLTGDGVLPSNEGRGYILRRLLRRVALHGRLLGIESLFLTALIDIVSKAMGDSYPEVKENKAFIERIAGSEEERFSETLKIGLNMINEVIDEAKLEKKKEISGKTAFNLYDTYGFPLELTKEIAEGSDLLVDEEGFNKFMEKQKEKAKTSWQGKGLEHMKEIYAEILDYTSKTEFVGYYEDEKETKILALIKGGASATGAKKGDDVEVVLGKTPFYAEMGGQIGDAGFIKTETGKVKVKDTYIPISGLYIHKGKVVEGKIKVDEKATATIDVIRRKMIQRNHTATHLLQWALRLVLGEHVKQSGSLVAANRFRFDFTHFTALTPDEIKKIERLVNDKIFEAHPVRAYVTSYEFAKDSGAIALFGERYEEFVRVVEIGNFSKELCGGTHVGNTSDIGIFKIVGETSVGANLRRIEAYTSKEALNYFCLEEEMLGEVAHLLKAKSEDTVNKVRNLLSELKKKEKEIRSLEAGTKKDVIEDILARTKTFGNVKAVIAEVKVQDVASLRNFADILKEKLRKGIVVLGAMLQKKAIIVAVVTQDLVRKGFSADNLLDEIAPIVGGGGGGRADMAQAGGKDFKKLPEALKSAEKYIAKLVKSK